MVAEILQKLIEKPNVKMRDPITVRTKLEGMISAGFDKLIVISDFDHTLSRHWKDGKRCPTTHGIFELQEDPEHFGFTKENQQQLISMRDKFLKIEFCPKMSVEEKIPHMIEWWSSSHDHIVEWKLTRDYIRQITVGSKIILRERVPQFVQSVDKHKVPLIVFSAGIGDIIQHSLEENIGQLPQSLHIVSNMMQFNAETDVCESFSEPIIHTFNKNSTVIQSDAPFFNEIVGRTCVLLLGDSLGDVHMDIGVKSESIVLRVGFLNFNVEKLIDKYLNEYDIVLIDDPTFVIPLAIFDGIQSAIERLSQTPALKNGSGDETVKVEAPNDCNGNPTTVSN